MSRTALDGAHSQHHDSLTNANFSTEPPRPLLFPVLALKNQVSAGTDIRIEQIAGKARIDSVSVADPE